MISKTQGICLNYIKYKESSIIARFFTREYGSQSYIINGIRSPRSKRKLGFFEPLTMLELVFYESKNSDLHRLSEYKIKKANSDIRFNIRKSAIALFLAEFLHKLLAIEQSVNEELYDFLSSSVNRFEALSGSFENFHIQLLLKMSQLLGFGYDPDTMHLPGSSSQVDEIAHLLISSDYGQGLEATGSQRLEVLEAIIKYYRMHSGQSLEIKSLEVLHRVFS